MTQATIEKPVSASEPAAKADERKMRPLWKSLAEFVFVFLLCLLLMEPVLTFAGVVNDENLDVDKQVGWAPMPNRAYTYRKEGFSNTRINSFGMVDFERNLQKPAGTFRIAVMGDSLTEGQQVAQDKTYCAVLEKLLNGDKGGKFKKYEVLNFGVSGYNLGQEYLRMKTLALRFHPDLVIIASRVGGLLWMGPDPKLGFFNARPVFGVMPDGTLVEDHNIQNHWLKSGEGKRMQNTRWLRYHSRTWGIISKSASQFAVFKSYLQNQINEFAVSLKNLNRQNTATTAATAEIPVVASNLPLTTAPSSEVLNSALLYLGRVADGILRESKKECDKAGCDLMLAYLPFKQENRDPAEAKIFAESAKNNSLKFIDLNPPIDALQKDSKIPFYFTAHYSVEGNKQIARQLHQFLKRSGY